ncbi:hypothetical protein PROFUN_01498 [Planoprotostelium fungivorum]|uniref:Uncharacterized protein n=1 Tax=Planoprotostelium fungivorum TaxID=1890364 RepID=A0A2P6NTH1_9EUKA|nr:hypothetical protein PROFUN_01498 [Planoprotostelium fungivorum]
MLVSCVLFGNPLQNISKRLRAHTCFIQSGINLFVAHKAVQLFLRMSFATFLTSTPGLGDVRQLFSCTGGQGPARPLCGSTGPSGSSLLLNEQRQIDELRETLNWVIEDPKDQRARVGTETSVPLLSQRTNQVATWANRSTYEKIVAFLPAGSIAVSFAVGIVLGLRDISCVLLRFALFFQPQGLYGKFIPAWFRWPAFMW